MDLQKIGLYPQTHCTHTHTLSLTGCERVREGAFKAVGCFIRASSVILYYNMNNPPWMVHSRYMKIVDHWTPESHNGIKAADSLSHLFSKCECNIPLHFYSLYHHADSLMIIPGRPLGLAVPCYDRLEAVVCRTVDFIARSHNVRRLSAREGKKREREK